jgi:uncharacterized protein YyaL (SSP411 family)
MNQMINKTIKLSLLLSTLLLIMSCQSKTTTGNHSDKKGAITTGNHLKDESSPYLLQHAQNPVDWYPWKEEALAKAKRENKMLIISIGYSSCHWCHVMEHESFEDSAVAKLMNEHFVTIKVDREERPDVDDVYMTACHLSSDGSCGWPLNAFALPDGRPVWAGTYFPKDSWINVLNHFIKEFKESPEGLEKYATQMMQGIQQSNQVDFATGESDFQEKTVTNAAKKVLQTMDYLKGGRKGSPKFPLPNVQEMLLHYYGVSKDAKALKSVEITLDNMANGGIYDQIGGGFARYSTDEDWKAPHFEKMLYDNGQLVSLYAHAYQLTKKPLYKKVVMETLTFIERELMDKNGGFYSSLDADSEGEEGKFYVWNESEIQAAFKDEKEAAAFGDYYTVKAKGNWEHKNILWVTKSKSAIAKKHKITETELNEILEKGKKVLMKKRDGRIRPGLDDKVLTSWNALMLKGYVDAYRAFGDADYLKTALKNANFLASTMMQKDGRLNRNYKDGRSVINAFSDDYALLAEAYIALYEVTFEVKWLNKAKLLTEYSLAHFYDSKSGFFFYTSDLDDALITRKMKLYDNVISGSNSVMAKNLFKLGTYLYDKDYLEKSEIMLQKQSEAMDNNPNFLCNWLDLYLYQVYPPYEIAILGKNYKELSTEMQSEFLPNAFFLGGDSEGDLELLEGKLVNGETRIYVCQNKACKLPTKEVKVALELMK